QKADAFGGFVFEVIDAGCRRVWARGIRGERRLKIKESCDDDYEQTDSFHPSIVPSQGEVATHINYCWASS
ncbi:MAG: hypothetical protein EBS27_04305, partial [Actinobacteria bacterium]|nr:hypothetical protein [Actinomycetota bacterium]